jgi:hypothetical protein
MAFKQNGTVAFGKDLGITDTTTGLSNQVQVTEPTPGGNQYFGNDLDIYRGKIYIRRRNRNIIYTCNLDGTNVTEFYNGGAFTSVQGGTIVCGNGYVYTSGATVDDVIIFDLEGNVVNTFSFPVATSTNTKRYAVGYGKLAVADDSYNSNTGRVYLYDAVGNLIKTIENPESTTFDSFGESIFIANGKLIITAQSDDDGGINDGAYYIYDIWGNYISKRSYTNNSTTNGQLLVKAVGSGRIVSKVVAEGGVYTILIDDLDGNNIASVAGPGSSFAQYPVAIGNGRIFVNYTDQQRIYVYDLDGNQIETLTITINSPGTVGTSMVAKSGKFVVSDPNSDVVSTNDGVVYIYDTPHQTHYLDLLDGM